MSTSQRISKISRNLKIRHRVDHPTGQKTIKARLRLIPAIRKDRVSEALHMAAEIVNHYLVTQQKALEELVPHWIVRWFLRWVYQHYGFAAMSCRCKHGVTYFNLEQRATFSDPAEARHWANCSGGSYKPIPHDPPQPLPEITAQYGVLDFPQSEASADYRNRKLPFSVVPTADLERLGHGIRQTDSLIEEYRTKLA